MLARQTASHPVGPNYSGIATFVIAALAMVVGSLIKPASKEAA
jgi:hypothetical protein